MKKKMIEENCNVIGQYSKYEHILSNVKRKQKKKKNRAEKFNKIDWQKKDCLNLLDL